MTLDVAEEFYKARERRRQRVARERRGSSDEEGEEDNLMRQARKAALGLQDRNSRTRKRKRAKRDMVHTPTWMESTFMKMPLALRFLSAGAVLSVVALTTPYWVWIETPLLSDAHFGLWHVCIEGTCSFVHDNLVPDRDIPLWWHMTSILYGLGTLLVTMVMLIVRSNTEDDALVMKPTLRELMIMMSCVSVMQNFTSIYTFVSYFHHTDFLYEDLDEFDFHFSFYCAVLGTAATFAGGLTLLVHTAPSKKQQLFLKKKQEAKRRIREQLFLAQATEYAAMVRAQCNSSYTGGPRSASTTSTSRVDDSAYHSDVECYAYHRSHNYRHVIPSILVPYDSGWSDTEASTAGAGQHEHRYYRQPVITSEADIRAYYGNNYSLSAENPYY